MSLIGYMKDMDQDDEIELLKRQIKKLENKINGGNAMSKLIDGLVGNDCTITFTDLDEVKCRIIEADSEWVKLIVYARSKKENDKVVVVRVDSIERFELE